MSEPTLKIDNARFVLTLDAERRIVADGAIVVEGSRISRVGKSADLRNVDADQTIDASEMVVTPGFGNGHMHISYAHATRGIFPDDLGPAYLPNVFRLQSAMTPEEEYYTSLLAITELLKYGTTSFLDPGSTKHLDACMRAYEESGCRIVVGAQVTDAPNPLNVPVYSTAEAVDVMRSAVEEFDGALDGRVRAWAMPFSAEYASDELLTAAKGLADDRADGADAAPQHGASGASGVVVGARRDADGARLERLGVLGDNVTLAHGLGLDEAELGQHRAERGERGDVPDAAIKGGDGGNQGRLGHDAHRETAGDAGARHNVGRWARTRATTRTYSRRCARCTWPRCCTRTAGRTCGHLCRIQTDASTPGAG